VIRRRNKNMRKMLKLGLALGLVITLLMLGSVAVAAESQTFEFPSAGSTVVGSVGFIDADEIGYFWSVAGGDMVGETLSSSLPTIGGAILNVEVVTNVLYPGAYVDWDVKINGVIVDSFTVDEGFTGPIHREISFAPIAGPDYLVELVVTNEVAPGDGSHTLAYAGAYAHSIELISPEMEMAKAKVTGGGTADWPMGRNTVAFTAQHTGESAFAAKGQWVAQARDSDEFIKAEVVSLAVDGNTAWIGCIVTQTNSDWIAVGDEFIQVVVDNGEGKKAAADQMSSMMWSYGSDVSSMPTPYVLVDWTNGNVQIH
jgi:hypothetical protein